MHLITIKGAPNLEMYKTGARGYLRVAGKVSKNLSKDSLSSSKPSYFGQKSQDYPSKERGKETNLGWKVHGPQIKLLRVSLIG